jgi:hypothetical protein
MRPNRKGRLNPYGIDAELMRRQGDRQKKIVFLIFFFIGNACRPCTAFNTLRGRFLGTARIVSEAIEEEFFQSEEGVEAEWGVSVYKVQEPKGGGDRVGRGDILIIGKEEEGEECFLCAWCNARLILTAGSTHATGVCLLYGGQHVVRLLKDAPLSITPRTQSHS